jgi:2-oxoglutarate ferredoxin oxidoreductase subunit alpha
VIGASWAGARAMTATSGPGFSLMQENIGYACMTETPCVIIDVQRSGPSTGQATKPAQGDVMQARWGTHGDIQAIALCPQSPQEIFDLTIRAFNLSERFRTPVVLLTDESVGHMTELVTIPKPEDIELTPRCEPTVPPDEWLPYRAGKDLVPEMPRAGQGYRIITTGLTHDERGYPVITSEAQEEMVQRLADKIFKYRSEIVDLEEYLVDDADVVVVTYGISARPSKRAVRLARDRGIRAGMLRLRTLWPFADVRVRELAGKVKGIVVPEINMGQVSLEVERVVAGGCTVRHFGCSGRIHQPEEILAAIEGVGR